MSKSVTRPEADQIEQLALDMSIVHFLSTVYEGLGSKTRDVKFTFNKSSVEIKQGEVVGFSKDIAIPYMIWVREDDVQMTDEQLEKFFSDNPQLVSVTEGLLCVYAGRLAQKPTPEFKKKLKAFVLSGGRVKYLCDSLNKAGIPTNPAKIIRTFS